MFVLQDLLNDKYEALHDQLRHERELYEKSTNLLKEQLKKEAQSVEAAKESMEEVGGHSRPSPTTTQKTHPVTDRDELRLKILR